MSIQWSIWYIFCRFIIDSLRADTFTKPRSYSVGAHVKQTSLRVWVYPFIHNLYNGCSQRTVIGVSVLWVASTQNCRWSQLFVPSLMDWWSTFTRSAVNCLTAYKSGHWRTLMAFYTLHFSKALASPFAPNCRLLLNWTVGESKSSLSLYRLMFSWACGFSTTLSVPTFHVRCAVG
jgi:hypothetical protein